jgi:hypothetical protein
MPTYTQTVTAAANAARWRRDSAVFSNDYLWVGGSGADYAYDSMARFTSVNIPKNATIISAILSTTPYQVTGSPLCTIYGEDADSGALIDTAAKGVSAVAAKTTANTASGAWTNETNKDIDVKAIIEEITTRAGWASGNNINMLYYCTSDTGNIVGSGSISTIQKTILTVVFGWAHKIYGISPTKIMGIANFSKVMGI